MFQREDIYCKTSFRGAFSESELNLSRVQITWRIHAKTRLGAGYSGGQKWTPGVTAASALIRSHKPVGGELRGYFETFGIKKWIYLHSCLLTCLQQWSEEVTSVVGCLCSALTAADRSWGGGNVPYVMDVQERLTSLWIMYINLVI